MDSGYKGRSGIFEILTMDSGVRGFFMSGADSVTIKEDAVQRGMSTLFQDGRLKVTEGITTLEEVMRVTQE
jgi:general secretion pathway protein E